MNIKKKATLKAYVNSFGNITQTCQIAGIDRQTFYNWKDSDPKFKQALEDAQPKERFKDFLESKAVSRINKGSDKILLHALKTKGKDRGWAEKKEIDVALSGEVRKTLDLSKLSESDLDEYERIITKLENDKGIQGEI